jgi:uncharacterized protein YyaL (SSP411 family)
MPNRLARERSPYLLQHANNPVDWYPWGDDAFAAARAQDRPIFLSIGYSTCHWCHVMEHESFEDASIADVLNRDFISIKVDREERPDVDRVYMLFVQATTGAGGWPMSVWLTPELKPFFGGTYFPPESRWGRPGFVDVLAQLARAWHNERVQVLQSADTMVERLQQFSAGGDGAPVRAPVAERQAIDIGVQAFAQTFDRRHGGFGGAPKFPRPVELLFLLNAHAFTGDQAAKPMALDTLRAMALGGMRDHVGGGFHRYSVDAEWRVPHFEKMLYDQAQLVLAYIEAAQLTGEAFFAAVATDTLDYVRRDLTHPDGGLYSAEDADSVPPELSTPNSQPPTTNHQPPTTSHQPPTTTEGAFYIWRDEEIGEALGADADIFRMRFGIEEGGNAPFDPQNEFTGKNLLYTARPIDDIVSATGTSAAEVTAALDRARKTLVTLRAQRPRPHLDDKVLTAWNGLMIAAFARAARALDDEGKYLGDAQRAATFIRTHLWRDTDKTLLRRFRQGHAAVDGYAEDYAYLIFGLLELFQADGDPAWLEWALTLQQRLDELFWDPAEGGWFSTTGSDPSVLLRLKEEYDGAEPAASSVAVLNLQALAHLTGDSTPKTPTPNSQTLGVAELGVGGSYVDKIERTFGMFANNASMRGRAVPMMLAALSVYHSGMPQVVIAGNRESPDTNALMAVVRRHYLPTALVIPIRDEHRASLSRLLPWTDALRPREGRATAYVCREFACQAPATEPAQLDEQLRELR